MVKTATFCAYCLSHHTTYMHSSIARLEMMVGPQWNHVCHNPQILKASLNLDLVPSLYCYILFMLFFQLSIKCTLTYWMLCMDRIRYIHMYVLATVLVLHGQTAFSFCGVRKNSAGDIQILKLLFMPEGVKCKWYKQVEIWSYIL